MYKKNTIRIKNRQCPNLEYLMENKKIAPNSIDDQLNLPTLQESRF